MNAFVLRGALVAACLVAPHGALATSVYTSTGDTVPGTMLTTNHLAAMGLNLVGFDGATFSQRVEPDFGKGPYFELLNDVVLNDEGDFIRAGGFIYWDPDPVLNYGFTITDFGAASTFGFAITAGIAPVASGPYSVRVDFLGGLTDGPGPGNDVGYTPVAPPILLPLAVSDVDVDGVPEAQVLSFNRTTDGPGEWFNAGYDLGIARSGNFSVPFNESLFVPSRNLDNWDEWRFDLNFTGTGGGDAYAITGRAEIVPVPAPAALWLLAPAVAGFATRLRRRG